MLYAALISTLEREDDQFLWDKGQVLLGVLREHPDDRAELLEELRRETETRSSGSFALRALDADGAVLAESPDMAALLPAELFPPPSAADARPQAVELELGNGRVYRALAMRAELSQGTSGPLVQVAMDRTSEELFLSRYRWYAGAVLLVSLAGCGAVGMILVRQGLRPLRRIIQTTRDVRSSTLDARVDLTGLPIELAVLGATLNHMLDRLEDSFRRLARFSADIAHELRTPVNNLRGEVEVVLRQPRSPGIYREALTSSLEEFGRLSDLIDALLFLARAESPREQLSLAPCPVARELRAVVEFYEAAAQEAGVALEWQAEEGLMFEVDAILVRRAVSNLVANALRYTPRGGRVTVRAEWRGDDVAIEVADTGCGIAPEHLPYVFDRFYRADPARSGQGSSLGLGLALVQSIATLHRGACSITSVVGEGTRAELTLPRVRSEPPR